MALSETDIILCLDPLETRDIDFNEDNENASDSILFSCESDSNEIEESDLQEQKHFEPRVSTQRGIIIDCNEDS
jgi:hypothetical protein